jgi:hypothetical protein
LTDEPKTDLLSAKAEAQMVLGQIVTDVLQKTGTSLLLLLLSLSVPRVTVVVHGSGRPGMVDALR